ncbi:nuclear transcription factor Y subunit A-10-like isoform X2 [Magnolia sinica]|uniref:nuclear transcription factor Y subunit A-10-like isoform X2 n=1 Tax=Magnolia sinica TaxID=86752 RepID=UPI002659E9D8|nr:nuclear transcription factor Y subunit A-10-like isoform X2 [Magnolia sinica]
MQTACFKDHGGILQNPIPQSTVPFMPWWTTAGSQQIFGESFSQLKSIARDHPNGEDHSSATPRQGHQATDHGPILAIPEKEGYDAAKFSIFPGNNKDSGKGQKAQQLSTTISLLPSPPENQACFELGLGQPLVCANYPYMDQCYGLFATYGAQATHGRMLLPLNMTENGPIFVNAKQYHGILRRRQSRAKAELENKVIKARKPYLHESRHLHAMRRKRGCGGRFLNMKEASSGKGGGDSVKMSGGPLTQAVGSPSSEVQQRSDSGNLNSAKEGCSGSSLSGSEVTSMYSRGDVDRFQMEHLRPSAFHPLANVMDGGPSIGITSKWVTADGCCDLLKV